MARGRDYGAMSVIGMENSPECASRDLRRFSMTLWSSQTGIDPAMYPSPKLVHLHTDLLKKRTGIIGGQGFIKNERNCNGFACWGRFDHDHYPFVDFADGDRGSANSAPVRVA